MKKKYYITVNKQSLEWPSIHPTYDDAIKYHSPKTDLLIEVEIDAPEIDQTVQGNVIDPEKHHD